MITCVVRYVIDPDQIEAFEAYAKLWIPIVERHGGRHHGYFLPGEGASDEALALFSFESLSAYERYRKLCRDDRAVADALAHARSSKCIKRYDRTFLRPLTNPAD